MRGRFIVLEGGEGAGKSTNARYIQSWLANHGRKTLLTREPGGAPLAEAIRQLVLEWPGEVPAMSELLLMFAARAAHLQAAIKPALAADTDVICDRFVDSSYAYQGAGRGLRDAEIEVLEEMTVGADQPDLVIIFDLDPEVGLARVLQRGEQNRFEGESLDFQKRVREVFLQRARKSPHRYAVIDAGRDLAVVQADLNALLGQRL